MALASYIEQEWPSVTLLTMAQGAIYLGLASLMLSVPVANKCFLTATLLVFLSGTWLKHWPVLIKNNFIRVSLLLLVLFTLAIFYSAASWQMSLRVWDKYLKLAYLLFFWPLFDSKKARTLAIYTFIAGVMVSEVLTYLHYFKIIHFGIADTDHWLFVQNIDASFIVAFTAYLLANLTLTTKRWRWLFLVGLLLCSVDILLLNKERTGYLIYLALTSLFMWQYLSWRNFLAAFMALSVVVTGIYISSDKFSSRINQVFTNVADYRHGQEVTSIGLRLAFAKYSFKIIEKHWLLGTGTGSFQETYKKLQGPRLDDNTWPAHPHNEYIFIWFQTGIVGLLLFISWLLLPLRQSLQLPKFEQYCLQA